MKTISLFLIQLFFVIFVFAQGPTPADWGFKEVVLNSSETGKFSVYVSTEGISEEKPLLYMPTGCSGLPTMLNVNCGDKSTQFATFPPDQIKSFSKHFHVVFIGQAKTPFCDTVEVEEINPYKNLENYKPNEKYVQNCGIEWQVEAAKVAIDSLKKVLPVEDNKIIAMGHSEGGRIVSRIASENKDVSHLVCLSSGFLNQFYSSIINRRIDAAAGKITHEEAQEAIDELFKTYEQVYRNPKSTEDWYYGHPYKRWGSFCNDIPVDYLTKLEIPILVMQGTLDRSSPCLQGDYLKLEFIRLGKTNLTYKSLPGCDHSFIQVTEVDGEKKRSSKRKEVFDFVTEWIVKT